MQPQISPVREYFITLQDAIVDALESLSGAGQFQSSDLPGPDGTLSRPRVLEDGEHIEKAAVQFTHSRGA